MRLPARCPWALFQAYERAIKRAVERARAADGEAHVLDIGCGSGVLSLLAARAGAKSVVRGAAAALHLRWASRHACMIARRPPALPAWLSVAL